MDRIAIISDIHSNIVALKAVLKDIKSRQVTSIICLGDIIGRGPKPVECWNEVIKSCSVVLKGNVDELCILEDNLTELKYWTWAKLNNEIIDSIRKLPMVYEFYMSGSYIRFFHATPQSLHTKVNVWDNEEKKLKLFESKGNKEPDIVGYGDIHTSYMQHIYHKTIFNTGSVGLPIEYYLSLDIGNSDETTQASYAILEGEFNSKVRSSLSIQIIRVPYDKEETIRQAIELGIPQLEKYRRAIMYGSHVV